jgi:DNA-binding SARP family transcriptional activator/tetratricopeptide (TPR) repeat protein
MSGAETDRALRIHLLGRFEVQLDGDVVAAAKWKRKRPAELLIALALVPNCSLHREELIDRFWPEKDLEAGANNLYRAAHDLRRILGADRVSLHQGIVRLEGEPWIDVDAFAQAIGAGGRDNLECAFELYRGDLLPEDPYTDWLHRRRESLRQRFVDGALRLADLRTGDARIDTLRHVVSVDPCQERVHRQLMTALAKSGRRADALRQFADCSRALSERLDTTPTSETLALKRSIEGGTIAVDDSSVAISEPATVARGETPGGYQRLAKRLVGTDEPRAIRGRAQECEVVAGLIDDERGVLLVIGEAGVGKTRLAVEMARRACECGATVLAGVGHDFSATAPYTPFVDAWNDHLRSTGGDVADNPLLAFRATPGASAQEDRLRLFQSIESWLTRACRTGPVFLLIEDIHQADESSMQLFHHLARAAANLPLWLAATLREENVRVGEPLHALLAGLRRERLAKRILLSRLDREATRQLIEDVGQSQVNADAVFELSEGNPFYAEEVARSFESGSGVVVPSDLLSIVRERVAGLGRTTERFLAGASVVGLHFQFDVVQKAVDLPKLDALDSLEQALVAGVIEEDGRNYRFRHALTRQALYDAITHARRCHLHEAVAEVLEQRSNDDQFVELLAHHYQQADRLALALPNLRRAAERAQSRLGFGEGVQFLARALEVMEELGLPPGQDQLDTLIAIGSMRMALGLLEAAVDDLDRAEAMTGAEGWRPSNVERARALRIGGLALIQMGDLDGAERRLERSLELVGGEGGSDLSAVLYHFSQLRWHQGRHDEAFALAERCLNEAEARDDAEGIAKGYEMLALACHSLGEWSAGMGYEEKRQELAQGTLDVASAFDVHL